MKIINDRRGVLARLAKARSRRIPILSPNAETPDEMEGIFMAAQQFAEQTRKRRVTVGVGVTGGYPGHPQLLRMHPLVRLKGSRPASLKPPRGGLLPVALRWLDWLEGYTGDPWFNRVEVIPFLDHGWAPTEAALLADSEVVRRMGIIFFDASVLPFEENIVLTSAYVDRHGSQVVIEGCPDKIASQAEIQSAANAGHGPVLSRPEHVREFVRRTRVDLVVPGLGTEHRGLPNKAVRYHGGLARKLRDANGSMLVLHGTSSLGRRIASVGGDGIVKVNFYTAAVRAAGSALRRAWSGQAVPLPVESAAGSFIHATRRRAIRQEILAMLRRLATLRSVA